MAIRVNGKPCGFRSGRSIWQAAGTLTICVSILGAAFVLARRPAAPISQPPPPVVAEFDSVKIPVPAEPVPAGTRVKDIKFKTVAFPRHQVPSGALATLDSISEAVSIAPLPANLPLFPANFSLTAHVSNPVVERIPPGMRAITIRVDATSAVEGWAGSGSIVDVLLVEKEQTSVIAEKVKILSAERSVSPVEGGSAPNVPSTVTLLVTQEQCLAINTAIPLGKIAFALRSTQDEANWSDRNFTAQRLKGAKLASQKQGTISGYISIKERDNTRAFALADGRWIKAETVPEGFLVASRD